VGSLVYLHSLYKSCPDIPQILIIFFEILECLPCLGISLLVFNDIGKISKRYRPGHNAQLADRVHHVPLDDHPSRHRKANNK